MNNSSDIFNDNLKDQTKKILSEKILYLLNNKAPYKEVQDMAVFITDGLAKIKTNNDYLIFLNALIAEYPIEENEKMKLQNILSTNKEEKVITKLEQYIKNLDNHNVRATAG